MCSVPVTFGGGSWMQKVGAPGARFGVEVALRFPERVPLRLDGVGFEAFGEFHGGACRPMGSEPAKA